MKHPLLKYVVRTLLMASPLLLLVMLYVVRDPFNVVHPVATDAAGVDSIVPSNNAGFVSIETYRLHNAERHYDSFIFGSSMSQNYKAAYWAPYLPADASILHFDAHAESLAGIIDKMNYLNRHGTTIRHALIIIEEAMLGREPLDGNLLYVRHPATTGEVSWLKFHSMFFKAFCNLTQVKYALNPSRYEAQMKLEGMMSDEPVSRIEPLNESYYAVTDSLIACDPDRFFTPRRLAARTHAVLPGARRNAITPRVERELRTIKEILTRNRTDYIILVPPCNVKPQLRQEDLWLMRSIFGQRNVHDFSGYAPLVGNERCYYDREAHLISAKCKLLLDSAYRARRTPTIHNPYYRSH